MAASTSTQTNNNAEYERKNNPSTLMESITKQAEKARKYERVFESGLRWVIGYTNGNSEAPTAINVKMRITRDENARISHIELPIRGSGSRGVTLASTVNGTPNSR